MGRIIGVALVLAATAASAQDPLTFEAVAARYFAADTYCDAGKRIIRHGPPLNTTHSEAFARCGHRDGRFKHVENPGDRAALVNWSDGKKYHRYFTYNRLYQEQSFAEADHDLYKNRPELYPVFLFRFLASEPRELTEKERRAKWVQSFKPVAALTTAAITVFERSEPYRPDVAERMHVRNSDKIIVKHEGVWNGVVTRTTEVTSAELNRPLAAADLSHPVPLYARFSPQSNPPAFVALLFVAALLGGALVWAWLFARAAHPEDVADHRRRLWKFQRWSWVIVGSLLGVLGIITAISPGSGHPPAIVFVIVIAVWAGVIFGLAACFTLVSYPVQWILARRPA